MIMQKWKVIHQDRSSCMKYFFAEAKEEKKTEAPFDNIQQVRAAFALLEQRTLTEETFSEFFDKRLTITKDGKQSDYSQTYRYARALLDEYQKIEIHFLSLQNEDNNHVKAKFIERLFIS